MKETQKDRIRHEFFRLRMIVIRLQNELKRRDDYELFDGSFKCIDESFDELKNILD